MIAPRAERRLAAILVADVAGYSRLMGHDEAGTLAHLKACRREVLEPLLAEHRGRIVNFPGDCALCEFASIVEAVEAAVAIQRAMVQREADLPEARRIRFRIGINAGDVVLEGGDLYGDGVNVAARLERIAEPGGVCVSDRVREEVRGRLPFTFEDLGERWLKNIDRPVRAYRFAGEREAAHVAGPVLVKHNLPQPNRGFVGRTAELQALGRALANPGRTAITQPQAITGLSGIGKTQTALAYAYRHLADYDLVWWLHAEEPATLAADYAAMAQPLELDPKILSQAVLISAIRAELERRQHFLLVFDNATGPASLDGYLPRLGAGHILLTSRCQDWGDGAKTLELDVLPEAEAVGLLLGGKPIDPAQRSTTAALAGELGCLPLALAQAQAFMRARKVDVAGYRRQLAAYWPKVMAWRPPSAAYPLPVAQAWQASADHAARDCPAARELLQLLAFFAPDAIPRDLLGIKPEVLPEGLRDDFERDTAIEALGRFSLLRVDAGTLTVHRLVQAVTHDGLDEVTAKARAAAAVQVVKAAQPWPPWGHVHWPAMGALLPHALATAAAAERLGASPETVGWVLNGMALYHWARAAWAEAETLSQRAIALGEKMLGPEHPALATWLHNLALVYRDTGRYAEAEPLFRRTIADGEKTLGPEHPVFATRLNNLAGLYVATGRHAEAEPLCRRALAIGEKNFGPEHPRLITSLHNLTQLYVATGRHAEAEPLLQRALAISEEIPSGEHPVAQSLDILAQLYVATGRHAEAEPLCRRAVTLGEKALDPEHPCVAQYLHTLANLYLITGRLVEAEPLFERALAIREKRQPPDHPDLAAVRENYAVLLHRLGRGGEAAALRARAEAIRQRRGQPPSPLSP